MVRVRMISAVMLLALAQQGAAGPWPRGEGDGFFAASVTARPPEAAADRELSLYAEYGLTPQLTIGADLHGQGSGTGHLLLFARLPLPETSGLHSAIQASAGGYRAGGHAGTMGRLTLTAGRGFTLSGIPGWWTLDAAAEWRRGLPGPVWKLDGTVGLNTQGRLKPLLQSEYSKLSGQRPVWSLLPGLRIQAGPGWYLVANAELRSAQTRTVGIRLGLWQDF